MECLLSYRHMQNRPTVEHVGVPHVESGKQPLYRIGLATAAAAA
jgi:hypothetical protein